MRRPFPLKMLHAYVLLSIGVFLAVKGLTYFTAGGPKVVYHYLNDFLSIPIVATICLHVVWWTKKDRELRLDVFSIISLVALYALYFEYYLPQHSERYTADIWDVVCYALGGVVFYVLQKKP